MMILKKDKVHLKEKKIDVIYRRISTKGQSFDMQLGADKKYKEALFDDNYIEINEIVSANKVELQNRLGMQQIISLIKKKKVGTIYVYDRSRLAREYYEYMGLVQLFIKFNIKIIFTTETAYPGFNHDTLVEGANAIYIDEEGKSIARRNSDRHRKFPIRKFGYITQRDENGKISSYTSQSTNAKKIKSLFVDANKVNNHEEFLSLISDKGKLLGKSNEDVIRYLTDPFYAGRETNGSDLNRLSYVEEIVTEERFTVVSKIIEPFILQLKKDLEERSNENILQPHCRQCKKEMIYRKSHVGYTGIYTCSNKHGRIAMNVDDFNDLLLPILPVTLKNLNTSKINNHAVKTINTILHRLEKQLLSIDFSIDSIENKIALGSIDEYRGNFKKLNKYRQKRKETMVYYAACENYKSQTRSLVKFLGRTPFKKHAMITKIPFIIKKAFIDGATVSFELYFNDYLNLETLEGTVHRDVKHAK